MERRRLAHRRKPYEQITNLLSTMKYNLLFSASKVGGDTASKYDSFFEEAKALGATWDGTFFYLPEDDDICSVILKAAQLAGFRLIPAE